MSISGLSPAAWAALISVLLSTLYILAAFTRWLFGGIGELFGKHLRKPGNKRAGHTRKPDSRTPARPPQDKAASSSQPTTPGKSLKSLIKASANARRTAAADPAPDTLLFCASLRSAGGSLLGLSWAPDGSAIAAAADGYGIQLWTVVPGRDIALDREAALPLSQFELKHDVLDVVFGNTEFNQLAVLTYGASGAPDAVMLQLPAKAGTKPTELWRRQGVHELGAKDFRLEASTDSRGGYGILVSSSSNRVKLHVLAANGDSLGLIDTGGFQNYDVAISRDGRWIAAATFANDVKLFEVMFDRQGVFTGLHKAMALKGHSARVLSLGFGPNTARCATVSADGTLRTWDLAVRYTLQEDPRPLLKIVLPDELRGPPDQAPTRLAWGPSGVIAVARGTALGFFDEASGDILELVPEAHFGPITALSWGPSKVTSRERTVWPLATVGRDGRLRIWSSPSRTPKTQ